MDGLTKELAVRNKLRLPAYGWFGLALVAIFWLINWNLSGPRTHWGFFPLWLGYSLTIDALVYMRRGTSLLQRSVRKYLSLFIISAPVWWLFELMNLRTRNWDYIGVDHFSALAFALWTTLSFTTVIPAVFGSAELFASFDFVQKLGRGPVIRGDRRTAPRFFILGCGMLTLLLVWPRVFFPLIWLSIYFIVEPINIWLGNKSLAENTEHGDWRPVVSLWLGVLMTGFFWELWNFHSYPKWIYDVPWGNWLHIFEMPLLGYGGYLPFSLELFAVYHLIVGLFGEKHSDYLELGGREPSG